MMRLIMMLTALTWTILAGCDIQDKAFARESGTDALQQGANQGVKENAPCLTNLNGGLATCGSNTDRQRRLVLIRNIVLPADE